MFWLSFELLITPVQKVLERSGPLVRFKDDKLMNTIPEWRTDGSSVKWTLNNRVQLDKYSTSKEMVGLCLVVDVNSSVRFTGIWSHFGDSGWFHSNITYINSLLPYGRSRIIFIHWKYTESNVISDVHAFYIIVSVYTSTLSLYFIYLIHYLNLLWFILPDLINSFISVEFEVIFHVSILDILDGCT